MHAQQQDSCGSYPEERSWCGGAETGCGPVARRNERERKRVRLVNMGFAKLRQYIPPVHGTRPGKRLSKVETLRSAIDYIRQLRQMLRQPAEPPYYYHPAPLPQDSSLGYRGCEFGCPCCNEGSYPPFEGPHPDMILSYVHEPYLM